MHYRMKIAALLVCCALAGCASVQYRDAGKDKGSREWGPREIKSTVTTMTVSLHGYLQQDWKNGALLQVQKIRNRTSEHIDTQLLADELVTNLLKQRIQFVDETYTAEALKEMEKGMSGMIDPQYAVNAGELQSPNLYLFGDISDNVRFVDGKKLQYLVVTLKLKEIRTGRLCWQEQSEFLKASNVTNYSL